VRHWHRPSYWRWLWRERVGRDVKIFLACLAAFGLGVAGFLTSSEIAQEPVVSSRWVTVVHTLPGKNSVQVVTEVGTVTETGPTDTQLVTVTRAGREVVIEVPGKTITNTDTTTVRGPVREHVVTTTRTRTETQTKTNTQTQTETVDRPTTVTATTTQTETETRNVPGPTQTVTETDTQTVTHTQTETETATQTVTETVTEAP